MSKNIPKIKTFEELMKVFSTKKVMKAIRNRDSKKATAKFAKTQHNILCREKEGVITSEDLKHTFNW